MVVDCDATVGDIETIADLQVAGVPGQVIMEQESDDGEDSDRGPHRETL